MTKSPDQVRPGDPAGPGHAHQPTGQIKACKTPGCKASWEVLCHCLNRRFCQTCGLARRSRLTRKRRADRKAWLEFLERQSLEFFGTPMAEIMKLSFQEAQERYLGDYYWDNAKGWVSPDCDDFEDEFYDNLEECS